MPETSIVIRTFNEEEYLPALLEAISKQQYQDYEIIVVDSGSFDHTKQIALDYGVRLVEINSHDFTFGYSLNVGIQAASGRFIALISAHTEPVDRYWLGNLVEPMRSEKVAMTYGRQLGVDVSKFAEIQDFLRTYGIERRTLEPPEFFANNANSAVVRALWEDYPFDEALPGLEDIDWAKYWMERGYKVVYEPKASIYHIHRETWGQVKRRYEREAVAARWIGVKDKRSIPGEALREITYLTGDFWRAAREGCLSEKWAEIMLFRYFKAKGTLSGLWNTGLMDDRRKQEAAFFDEHFKAVVIERPHRAVLKEVKVPEIRPGEVLIKVAYEGICATDLELFEGTLGYYEQGLAKYPIIPGHEFSGRVVKVGLKVDTLEVGDPVVAECIQSCGRCYECVRENYIGCAQRKEVGVMHQNGAYAEYIVLPARFVHKLPVEMDLKTASLCEPTAVVLKGLKRIQPFLGEGVVRRCAVVGLGPIGHLCAQLLASKGHKVTAFDRNPLRRSYVEQIAFPVAVDDNLEHLDKFDVIVEATGHPDVLEAILHNSSAGVAILLLGLPYARRPFNFEGIVAYDKAIVGSVGSTAQDFREAISVLPALDLQPFLQGVFPLEEFEMAWQSCREHHRLKTLLEIDAMLNKDTYTGLTSRVASEDALV